MPSRGSRQALEAVLRDHRSAAGNHNPRVELLAAEAHGQLGALDYVLAATTGSRERYRTAVASYAGGCPPSGPTA